MKKLVILALAVCLVLGMAACGTSANTEPTPTVAPTPTSTPAPVDMVFSGAKASVGAAVNDLATTYMENTGLNLQWKRTSSGTAMAYTIADKTDIALLTRELKEEEKAVYDNLKSTMLCTEAIAVVAGANCPVDNITIDQLKKIFSGDITDWADLGGSGDISVYATSGDTSAGDAFQTLVLGRDATGKQAELDSKVCSMVDTAEDMGGIVEGNPLTIGFMPLSLVGDYKVKVLKVEGATASDATAKAGTYPLARNFYMVTVGQPSKTAQDFITYCTTDSAAQEALKTKGYILP